VIGVVESVAVLAHTTTHISLLARLSGGSDQTAWAEFSDRYQELIRSFARRQGVSQVDQDDIVQDVMLALTKAMPGFAYDPAKGKFRSYLKTVTLHAIFRKSHQKHAPLVLGEMTTATGLTPAAEDKAEEAWEAEWRSYHLRLAMRTIRAEFNAQDVAAFNAYVGTGATAEQAAADVGLNTDQVYQAKSRILKRLSEIIATQVGEEG
jgi:RNA polymerase sigma-70 factor (ECF subfamily)